MVLAILVFIGLLLVLVLAHEVGHFMTAKWAGARVEEFGFGFPPRLFSFMRHGTRYSFNLLPIGGFVKIEGEDMEQATAALTSFASKSAPWRIFILAAGVIMNMVVAVVLLSFQAGVGFPTVVTESNSTTLTDFKTYIVDVAPQTPASDAGVQALDRIVRLGEVSNPTLAQVQQYTVAHAGTTVVLEVERQGQHQTMQVTPRRDPPPGQGALGISLAQTGLTKVPWWQAPWYGVKRTGQMLVGIVTQVSVMVAEVIRTQQVSTALTGPIGIAVYTNEATKLGVSYVLEFAALISINLALLNILPFPALDGGRIVFVLFEALRGGRRLPVRFEQWTHTIGFALLIGLMVLITLKDIGRYF